MTELIEPQELKIVSRTPVINLIEGEIALLENQFKDLAEELINEKYQKFGLDFMNKETIGKHVQIISLKESKYSHHFLFYGTENEKRIISIQNQPTVRVDDKKIEISCIFF